MRIKTIIIIIVTILLTVVLMQNTDDISFKFLFATFQVSKLIVMLAVAVIAFVIGLIIGRPRKPKNDIGTYYDTIHGKDSHNTLSDDDKEYIS